jgi:hypothetical protein
VENNGTWWPLWLGIALVASVLFALFARRRGGGPTSLRPPASTPALNKIEMINRYREQYGVSLAEAKEAVEAQLSVEKPGALKALGGPVPFAPGVEALVREGKLIEAIKLYREETGVSLQEAKDAIERMRT